MAGKFKNVLFLVKFRRTWIRINMRDNGAGMGSWGIELETLLSQMCVKVEYSILN